MNLECADSHAGARVFHSTRGPSGRPPPVSMLAADGKSREETPKVGRQPAGQSETEALATAVLTVLAVSTSRQGLVPSLGYLPIVLIWSRPSTLGFTTVGYGDFAASDDSRRRLRPTAGRRMKL